MACILRLPAIDSVGVISFTTQERTQIQLDRDLSAKLTGLKSNWILGLHHNWHDYNFKYDPLFDFSFAGEGDLNEINGAEFCQIQMDACNFVPEIFRPAENEKFWDILYVARAVYFKRIPEFFLTIRELFDRGNRLRVLFICPVPPYSRSQKKTAFYDIRKEYDRMFNEAEKKLFTLLTINYRYPFPFDLDSLAFFYRSSRVFVHTADDERRCRVAAYAWATGMPVVCMDQVASLIPRHLRESPVVYKPETYDQFPEKILEALRPNGSNTANSTVQAAMCEFNEVKLLERLDIELEALAHSKGLDYVAGKLFGKNLGLRLGRHHDGVEGTNSFSSNLRTLVDWISHGDFSNCYKERNCDLELYVNDDVMKHFKATPMSISFKTYILAKIAKIKGVLFPLKKAIFG
jgi:glycosyltransferase involved in cell wall biosynthesis